ncbi:MAG: C39 family peptidase [Chloroflexi bacterium]|nr:C39 family peptidase [Chloroflexota bacterium]
MSSRPSRRRQLGFAILGSGAAISLFAVGFILIAVPSIYDALRWKIEETDAALRDILHPHADTLPTPIADAGSATAQAPTGAVISTYEESAATPTPASAATSLPTAIVPSFQFVEPPPRALLAGEKFAYQTANNCGPATLAMLMTFYGWKGTQADVAAFLKPNDKDKNVRWDELVYYVKTEAGWLDATFRVGGTVDIVKRFIANGYPVIAEKGLIVKSGWVGHYVLITGYDDQTQTWLVQDVTRGPDQYIPYTALDKDWQQFNRLFILVYPAGDKAKIMALLGPDADEGQNRQRAFEIAQAETKSDPNNAFAWFNLGSNLNYFERYTEAAAAFDKARTLGLPWRMLFYQFGPYRAYFNIGRFQDVVDLADAALGARPELEESFFWRGWAKYSLGDYTGAVEDFRAALQVNPNFGDAKTALATIGSSP